MKQQYPIHTIASAPEESRGALETTQKQLRFVPNLMAVMAESPQLVKAFQQLTGIASTLTLGPLEREIAQLAIGAEVGCTHCIAFHTMALQRLRAPETLIRAVRDGGPLDDARLAVLRDFARAVVTGRGDVEPELQQRFFDAGFTPRQALEIVFLHGMLTLSMYASRLADVPLDGAFEALAS
jgi:AhpD family alkylhydroperoxidase